VVFIEIELELRFLEVFERFLVFGEVDIVFWQFCCRFEFINEFV
jgi:hypothetical protein